MRALRERVCGIDGLLGHAELILRARRIQDGILPPLEDGAAHIGALCLVDEGAWGRQWAVGLACKERRTSLE